MDLLKAKFARNREKMDLMMAEPKRFVENYLKTFDANREDLVNLYREESGMNFSGQMILGKEAIVAKLASLQQCQQQISGIACLPCELSGGVLALAYGYLWLDGKPDAYLFYQSFRLLQEPEGSYYIAQQAWLTHDFNNPPPALT
ncbi:nuclear transport factor 2B-like [Syzygium oleosum]|nr:nuclear transport factor 2B-like [Syzygium oleosum]